MILAQVAGELGALAAGVAMDDSSAAPVPTQTAAEVPTLDISTVPAAERIHALRDFVRGEVMTVLRSDPTDPPARHIRFADLGMDSLMAVQLRNRLSRGLAMPKPLAASVMFDHPTIDSISTYLLDMLAPAVAQPAPAKATPKASVTAEDVSGMDDADIEALLNARLKGRR